MNEFNKQVGDTVFKHVSLFPFTILAISKDRPFPYVRMRSRLTGRIIVTPAIYLHDFYHESEPRW